MVRTSVVFLLVTFGTSAGVRAELPLPPPTDVPCAAMLFERFDKAWLAPEVQAYVNGIEAGFELILPLLADSVVNRFRPNRYAELCIEDTGQSVEQVLARLIAELTDAQATAD